MAMKQKSIRPPGFGPVVLVFSDHAGPPVLVRVLIPQPGISAEKQAAIRYGGLPVSHHPVSDALCSRLKAFLRGDAVAFSLDRVDLAACSPFQRAVLLATHAIPRGEVRTYGQIATRAGAPGAARAAGNALARNPFPLIIPCHRAIRSNGLPGGYRGGPEMKKTLLAYEGIVFNESGHAIRTLQR